MRAKDSGPSTADSPSSSSFWRFQKVAADGVVTCRDPPSDRVFVSPHFAESASTVAVRPDTTVATEMVEFMGRSNVALSYSSTLPCTQ